MNYQTALQTLRLTRFSQNEITPEQIKKQYYQLALKYHPDKNGQSEESHKHFIELKLAYDYLIQNPKYNSDPDSLSESDSETNYKNIIEHFICSVCGTNSLYVKVIKEMLEIYEEYKVNIGNKEWSLIETIVMRVKEWDNEILMHIFSFFCRYKKILDIATDFMDKIEELINGNNGNNGNNSNNQSVVYSLNPSLEDLLDCKIYKLPFNNQMYYVPLWQYENYFDITDTDTDTDTNTPISDIITHKEILVLCIPILEENVQLDDKNNIHIDLNLSLEVIREKLNHIEDINSEENPVYVHKIGNYTFDIYLHELKLQKNQTVIFKAQGIPQPQMEDVMDISMIEKSDVLFHIRLF